MSVFPSVSSYSLDTFLIKVICNLPVSQTTIVQGLNQVVIALLFLSPVTFVYPVSEVKRGKSYRKTEELLPVL